MQAETFQHEITFLKKTFDTGKNEWGETPVTLIATFKELSRTDREQHKLHFKIMTVFNGKPQEDFGETKKQVMLDYDAVYDITVDLIKRLLIVDEPGTVITITDKNEILNDSGALLKFGLWAMAEKIFPFFQTLMPA